MMSRYLRIVNWDKYQHYRNRRPPWVKFYTELLHPSNRLNDLPIPTRFLFDRLLLLAAEYDNAIPNDHEFIASQLRMSRKQVHEGLAQLEKGKWISQSQTRRRASKLATEIVSQRTETEKEQPTPPTPPTNTDIANLIELTTARLGGI